MQRSKVPSSSMLIKQYFNLQILLNLSFILQLPYKFISLLMLLAKIENQVSTIEQQVQENKEKGPRKDHTASLISKPFVGNEIFVKYKQFIFRKNQ